MQNIINQNIIIAAKKLGIKDIDLAKEMGVKKQFITQWKDNTGNVPLKRVLIFLKNHPEIDANWLIRGEGSMYKVDQGLSISTNSNKNKYSQIGHGQNIINEPAEQYQSILEMKDREIAALREVIETQKQLIKKLNE